MMEDLQRELDAARGAVMAAEAEAEKWRERCIASKMESVQAHRDAAQDMAAFDVGDVIESSYRIERSDSDANIQPPVNISSNNLRQRTELLLQELSAKLTSTPTHNSVLINRKASSPTRDVSAEELIDTLRNNMRLMTEQQATQEARAERAEGQVRQLKNLLYAAESLVIQNGGDRANSAEQVPGERQKEELHDAHEEGSSGMNLLARATSITSFAVGIAAGLLFHTYQRS